MANASKGGVAGHVTDPGRQDGAVFKERKADPAATALAEKLLLDALHAGVEIRPIDGKVIVGPVQPELQARLDGLWPEIEAFFAVNAPGPLPATVASAAPSWPEPEIVKEPHFGADHVPSRYRPEWEALLSGRPEWATGWQWEQAILGCRDLFGEWGAELLRLNWRPDDIFDRWHGLAWFLKGGAVTAIGPWHAFLQDGRIFERKHR